MIDLEKEVRQKIKIANKSKNNYYQLMDKNPSPDEIALEIAKKYKGKKATLELVEFYESIRFKVRKIYVTILDNGF